MRGTSLGETSVRAGLRALMAGETRIALVLATLVIGAGAALALAFALPADQRTFAAVAPLTQLILSVLTPFAAVLLIWDLRDGDGKFDHRTTGRLRSRWIAAGIYGLAIGLYGNVVVALATALAAGPAANPWPGGAAAMFGGLLIQLIPVGVGCAAGLLIRRMGLADLATIAVPLAVTGLIGGLAPRGVADWVTPLGAAGHLVPGPMMAIHWVQWIVTAGLWVLLPNWLGSRRLNFRAKN